MYVETELNKMHMQCYIIFDFAKEERNMIT